MKGSKKQIKWAQDIINDMKPMAEKLNKKRPDHPRTANYNKAIETLSNASHAKWVIKFRNWGINEIDEFIKFQNENNNANL